MEHISIDDFKKVEIRVGEILSAEKVVDADKLLKLTVRFGKLPALPLEGEVALDENVEVLEKPLPGDEIRQIISGIAAYYPNPEDLVGIKCAFAYNLAPRTIRGHESNGMILAATGDNGVFSLLRADPNLPPGSVIR
jgi:methionyl-tRNA synthetase